ncbi:MAG: alpha/beta fold hydrolase, partial [Christensenellales bacterium]|nr:alpha/beta fold hydrolase [Christensenellales bacterium]
MLYHAKNATLRAGDLSMDYVRFGNGPEPLVVIPGLGDGLKTVKGAALPLAVMYRGMARSPYTVYVLSRRAPMPPGFTTADMGEDVYLAMGLLGIQRADVVGISQGGMIAQHLALRHPEAVKKLVLAVTICRQNPLIQ